MSANINIPDNAADTENPTPIAGKAVTSASYAPAYTDGDRATVAVDKTSGGILTHGRALELVTDFVSSGGDVAHDAVDSGSPMKLGGKALNDVAQTTVSSGDRVNALFDTTGRQVVKIGGKDAINLLASAARTTTQTSAAQTYYHVRGITLWLNISAYTAGGLTVSVENQDVNTGNYAVLTTFALANSAAMRMYQIYPGIQTAAGFVNAVVSRVFRVVVTVSDATSITYSLGLEIEP